MNTVRSKTVLKTYFETGDKPTQSQFNDLITSAVCSTPNATGADNAESVNIIAGSASSTGNAGSIVLNAGEASGTGVDGSVQLNHPSGASITIGTNGHITISSPNGITITNSTTGDSVSY